MPTIPTYTDHARLLVVKLPSGAEVGVTDEATWRVRRDHILGHVQAVMGRLPGAERRVPLDIRKGETTDEGSFLRHKLTFASEPGDRVPAWLLVPKDMRGKQVGGVLCLHQTVGIGKDEPAGLGGRPNLRYARELAERGHVTLAPDYPNFGEHQVDPYALGYASASMKAIWDNLRAVDLLQSLPEVDPNRLGVIGHSLGGHNAIFTALFDERLKVVVSSCGFTSFPKYYGGNLAGWSHKGYMPRIASVYGLSPSKVPFDFPELIGGLAPRAVFVNAPMKDANFDVDGVKDCIASAGAVYKLLGAEDRLRVAYPEAEHDFPPAEREQAYREIDRTLGAK